MVNNRNKTYQKRTRRNKNSNIRDKRRKRLNKSVNFLDKKDCFLISIHSDVFYSLKKRIIFLIAGGLLIGFSFLPTLNIEAVGDFIPDKNEIVKDSKYTFAKEPVKIDDSLVKEISEEENLPRRIIIPQINLDLDVDKSRIIDGYWDVFEDKAGFGSGSATPGKKGNTVIFAHAREKLFAPLKNIKMNSYVYILTNNKWYKYQVVEKKEVYPWQTEVIAPTSEDVLTLYTCAGFADQKRLIVKAVISS